MGEAWKEKIKFWQQHEPVAGPNDWDGPDGCVQTECLRGDSQVRREASNLQPQLHAGLELSRVKLPPKKKVKKTRSDSHSDSDSESDHHRKKKKKKKKKKRKRRK